MMSKKYKLEEEVPVAEVCSVGGGSSEFEHVMKEIKLLKDALALLASKYPLEETKVGEQGSTNSSSNITSSTSSTSSSIPYSRSGEIHEANQEYDRRIQEKEENISENNQKRKKTADRISSAIQSFKEISVSMLGEDFVEGLQKDDLFQNPTPDKMKEFETKYITDEKRPAVQKIAIDKKELVRLTIENADLEAEKNQLVDDRRHNNLLPAEMYRIFTDRDKALTLDMQAMYESVDAKLHEINERNERNEARNRESVREMQEMKKNLGAQALELQAHKARSDAQGHEMQALKAKIDELSGPKKINCEWAGTAFDEKGVFYHIGTKGGKAGYTNPCGQGWVAATSNGCAAGSDSYIVNRTNAQFYTSNAANSWVKVDLQHRRLSPTHYCIRQMGYSSYYMRTWELQGSNDDSNWVALKTHIASDPTTINADYATGHWPIPGQKGNTYRYFRIIQTGVNTAGNNILSCSFELYGELRVDRDHAVF